MKNSKFNLLSLFSGAGGMDLGFVMSGRFKTTAANDILKFPAETYAHNFKHKVVDVDENYIGKTAKFILGDVERINFGKFEENSIDAVVGGPPCQDFSVVRGPEKERQGIAVKRGRLYAHFVRALIHLQPKIFVFENVPGLKSANKGKAFKTILDDFRNLQVKWKEIRAITKNSFPDGVRDYELLFSDVVDSAVLGIPQRRRRLIILGIRKDIIEEDYLRTGKLKQTAENLLFGESSLFKKYPLTPIEVFEGLPLPELDNKYRSIMKEYEGVDKETGTKQAETWKKNIWNNLTFNVLEDYFKLNGITEINSSEADRALEQHKEVLKKLGYYKNKVKGKNFSDGSNDSPRESPEVLERMRMIPPDENCIFVKGTKWEVEGRGLSLIYRRLNPLKPSYTVVAHGGGGTWGYHYERSKGRLTNRERARLQTFPDSFLFKGSTSRVRAQIGEAVPPLLGEKIAEISKEILGDS